MDKTSMTLGWLVGQRIAGMRRAKREPIAYRYGGLTLPKIHNPDGYPYLVAIHFLGGVNAYAFSAPLTAKPAESLSGGTYYEPIAETPFLMCTLTLDWHARNYWSEWETVTDSDKFNWVSSSWTSHDIVASDGTIPFAGGEPVPVYLPAVLYDGEVTTEKASYSDSAAGGGTLLFDIADGDILRITINGISGEYTAEVVETSGQVQVGNAGLNGNDVDAPDDGGDWLVAESTTMTGYPRMYFYTRTAGTYQLKIELIRTAPSTWPPPTPSPYTNDLHP